MRVSAASENPRGLHVGAAGADWTGRRGCVERWRRRQTPETRCGPQHRRRSALRSGPGRTHRRVAWTGNPRRTRSACRRVARMSACPPDRSPSIAGARNTRRFRRQKTATHVRWPGRSHSRLDSGTGEKCRSYCATRMPVPARRRTGGLPLEPRRAPLARRTRGRFAGNWWRRRTCAPRPRAAPLPPAQRQGRREGSGHGVSCSQGRKRRADRLTKSCDLFYCRGTSAIARSGPPDPPSIFIGSAMSSAPRTGSWSRFVRFSKPGTFRAAATRWTWKSVDRP